ncbi:unnamed protein product [Phyllotreta striolata]|uniref:Uncharacterized protein n=1 Tax=Phyllotreta striolata TaxID=444603 RepID=A0A9N9THZ6_PHYSR|nr:unnamed protein product [Phyllotreta striolata]
MKFSVCVLFLIFAVAGTWAATCTNCPDSVASVLDLVRKLQETLQPILDKLPLGLGRIVNELLNLIVNLLGALTNGLSGGLEDVLKRLGDTLSQALGSGTSPLGI